MNRARGNTLVWGIVIVAVIAAAVVRLRTAEEASSPNASEVRVTSSQKPAINAIQTATPVSLKTDDEGKVTSLVATGPEMTDAVAANLKDLGNLRILELQESGISDAALEFIGMLPELESLTLSKTAITSVGLKSLVGLKNLRQLALAECQITDEGLDTLAQITSIQVLNLSQTDITDDGLALLHELANLEKLYLRGTQVTGAGFSSFDDHERMILLNLTETELTEVGIENLRCFPHLQMLYLNRVEFDHIALTKLMEVITTAHPELTGLFLQGATLTDDSIEPLKGLSTLAQLSVVNLYQTAISKQAFRKLAAETPDVNYLVDYPAGDD